MKRLAYLAAFVSSVALAANDQPITATPTFQDTVVTSDRLEMIGLETENQFFFYDNVVVTGTNLRATADEMTVFADRVVSKAEDDSGMGDLGTISKIILKGNVVIQQVGREATAEEAEILPRTGRVILTGGPPVVRDSEGTVTGYRIELYKNEKKARVFGDTSGESGERPRVTLPGFDDLGYQEGN
ncbi:MAG: LptA/OstA family protein [Verrucomicrobiota bacterium]